MKKVIILIVVLLLLGGGAVGAMAVFGIGPFAKAPTVAAPPPPPKMVYIDMDSLSIPVFIPDQKPRQVFMTLRLETTEPLRKKVEAMMPRIRDTLLTDLHNVLPNHLKNRPTTDLAQLKPRMLTDISKVMGAGVVSDVLVVEIFER